MIVYGIGREEEAIHRCSFRQGALEDEKAMDAVVVDYGVTTRIYEELFFQNTLSAIPENELAMPMPSSKIVFW